MSPCSFYNAIPLVDKRVWSDRGALVRAQVHAEGLLAMQDKHRQGIREEPRR
jgi:hypothetical protein